MRDGESVALWLCVTETDSERDSDADRVTLGLREEEFQLLVTDDDSVCVIDTELLCESEAPVVVALGDVVPVIEEESDTLDVLDCIERDMLALVDRLSDTVGDAV